MPHAVVVDTRDIPFTPPAPRPHAAAPAVAADTTTAPSAAAVVAPTEVPTAERLAARQYHVDVPFTAPQPHFVNRLYDNRVAFYESLQRKKQQEEASSRSASEAALTFEPKVTPHPIHAFNRSTHVVERLSNDASRRMTELQANKLAPQSQASSITDPASGKEVHLPRVAREYDVALREHEMHIAFLREQQAKEQQPTFKPQIASAPPKPPTVSSIEHIAASTTTVADAYRAATIAKRLRDREAAKTNILEDEKHRQRTEALVRTARERSHSVAGTSATPATASPPPPQPKKLSRDEARAVTQRLYADGVVPAHVAVQLAIEQQRLEEAAKAKDDRQRRAQEYERARKAHDAAVALQAQQEAARQAKENPRAARVVESLEALLNVGPRSASESEAEKTERVLFEAHHAAAVNTVDRAVQDARIRRRQEEAAALVLQRRLESEAKREAARQLEQAIAQQAAARYAKAPQRSSSAVAHAAHRDPNSEVAAAPTVPATAAAAAAAEVVKGFDAVIQRRELAKRMKEEAAAKLTVRAKAVQRQRDSEGRLVTRANPFPGLESHEQAMFERRQARMQEVLNEIAPTFEPVAKSAPLAPPPRTPEKEPPRAAAEDPHPPQH